MDFFEQTCNVVLAPPKYVQVIKGNKIKKIDKKEKVDEIVLIGLCTDICVISNAMIAKAALYESKITVDAAACAGVTPESHERALEAMKMCQINVINR